MALVAVYDQDFLAGEQRPLALYNQSPVYVPMAGRSDNNVVTAVAAGGAFWPDGNHTSPGKAGWLNLMCVLYHASVLDPLGRPGTVPAGLDLRDAVVRVRCRAVGGATYPGGFYLPRKTRIGWWIQTWDPGACDGNAGYANWFQTRDLICEQMGALRPNVRNGQDTALPASLGWVDCTIPLSNNPGDWMPMGANPAKADTYGNSSIEYPLQTWCHDMGVIAITGDHGANFPAYPYPLGYGGGEFQIDRITLQVQT